LIRAGDACACEALASWLRSTPVVVQLHQLGKVIGYNFCQQHCRT
jgi:hypothetical protein